MPIGHLTNGATYVDSKGRQWVIEPWVAKYPNERDYRCEVEMHHKETDERRMVSQTEFDGFVNKRQLVLVKLPSPTKK